MMILDSGIDGTTSGLFVTHALRMRRSGAPPDLPGIDRQR
jgi:hypothetical protein